MFTVVGNCPKCGAPIYSPSVWMGVTPPPVTYTCNCVCHAAIVPVVTTGWGTGESLPERAKSIC